MKSMGNQKEAGMKIKKEEDMQMKREHRANTTDPAVTEEILN